MGLGMCTMKEMIPRIENPSPSYDPLLEGAGERIRAAVADLMARGIIDAEGKCIRTDLPHDMRPSSECTRGDSC